MKTKWLSQPSDNSDAPFRVVCLPFAGGGTNGYNKWAEHLGGECGVLAVRLPGRESRWGEPLITNMETLVDVLVQEISPFLDRPFAVYGHSMGGRIGFELIRALRYHALPQPEVFFVSACRPPHLPRPGMTLHTLDDGEFIRTLGQIYDGIPKVILDDPDMLKVFLPIIRGDITLFESAVYHADYPLDCPIRALCGSRDRASSFEYVKEWACHSRVSFAIRELEGGHFFLNDHAKEITDMIMLEMKS